MADNLLVTITSGQTRMATEEIASFSGDANAHVQLMREVGVEGSEGSRSIVEPAPRGRAATATITTTAYSTTNVTLKAANAARRRIIIWNDTDKALYLKFGATATTDDWTWKLNAGEAHPFDLYTGRIDGIWESGGSSGKARVTELTA